MDTALDEIGLTTPVYAAMTVIDQHPNISKADLARLCFVRPQSMTRVMTEMERPGGGTRAAPPAHGRILPTRLTARGRRNLDRVTLAIDGVMDGVLDGLTLAERRQFV